MLFRSISPHTAARLIDDKEIDLFPLLNAAYQVRKTYWKNEVAIHILNNTQNGYCAEDCHYCAQAKNSEAEIEAYPMKKDEEIIEEAKRAYESGAFRYCMVMAGRGPSKRRLDHFSSLIKTIKEKYPLEVCLSAGLLDQDAAAQLKEAGLDRLNHNLNTSESMYEKICTTHTFEDRMNTLTSAQTAGLELCSGLIVGMGESASDVVDVALKLRSMKVQSIPVNFFIPIPGAQLKSEPNLTPEKCLRILSVFCEIFFLPEVIKSLFPDVS